MTFAPGAKASAHVRALLDKWKVVLPKLGHFKTGEPGRQATEGDLACVLQTISWGIAGAALTFYLNSVLVCLCENVILSYR